MRILLLFMCSISVLQADLTNDDLHKQAVNIAKNLDPTSVPGHQHGYPEEVHLNDVSRLEKAQESAFESNAHGQTFKEIAEQRAYFSIDAQRDALIQNSSAVSANPEGFLQSNIHNKKQSSHYEYKTCRESKPSRNLTCQYMLQAPMMDIEPEEFSNHYRKRNFWENRRRGYRRTRPQKIKDEVVTLGNDVWTHTCSSLIQRQKKGLCKFIKKVCPNGSQTIQVNGHYNRSDKIEGRPVTRPCWLWEHTYECNYASNDTCQSLRDSSCEQISSNCISKIGNECVEWEQRYRCLKDTKDEAGELVSSGGFKLPDVSTPIRSTPNTEMNDAIAKLSIFEDMQAEMRQTPGVEQISVFKGKTKKCRTGALGIRNCCGTGSGWGKAVGVSCTPEEKQLAKDKSKKVCVTFGRYCSSRTLLGICVEKSKASCCFPSRLSRIVQVQGRRQLGIEWGQNKAPVCRGITPEELSRIDFDQLDLSEVFDEMQARTKNISAHIVGRNMKDRVNNMTSGLGNASSDGENQ